MNPQQEAVALWLFLEERGASPSVGMIASLLRGKQYGRLRFRDSDLSRWLSKFRRRPESTGAKNPSVGREAARTGEGYVREKEVSLPLVLDSKPTVSRPRRKKIEPKPADLLAWRISDVALAVIREHHSVPITDAVWRTRNNNHARQLAEGGRTADEVGAALRFAFTDPAAKRYYGRITSLAKLIEHWAAIEEMAKTGDSKPVERGAVALGPSARKGDYVHVDEDGDAIIGNASDPPPLAELLEAKG